MTVIWPRFTGRVDDRQTVQHEGPITVAVERRVDADRQAEALAWVQTGDEPGEPEAGLPRLGWVRADAASSLRYALYHLADATTP